VNKKVRTYNLFSAIADEYNIEELTYNDSLSDLQYKLEQSIKEQKEDCIGLAMKIYNKIKKIKLSHSETLNSSNIDYEVFELNDENTKDKLNNELKKLKLSLTDNTSPIMSTIKELHRIGMVGDTEDTTKLINSSAEEFELVAGKLEGMYEELERKEQVMVQLQQAYERSLTQAENEPLSMDDSKMADLLEKEIFDAYIEYQRTLLKEIDMGKQMDAKTDLPDKHKIKVIRSIFGVMEPGSFNNSGTDLLEFGIAHDVPDAVRLGENIAGLNDEDFPDDLLYRLQQYKLKRADQLRERIQHTGPMKSIIQRRKESLMTVEDRNGFFPSNYEELKHKYNDKYNRWRLPSIYAVDHKKYGVLGEVLGQEKLDKLFAQFKE
jgi:hypothetical protein